QHERLFEQRSLARAFIHGAVGQLAQANVISAALTRRLRRFPLPCSIARSPVTESVPAQRRIGPAMKHAAERRTESDARRSALMAAAQAGDRIAYETLLRDSL